MTTESAQELLRQTRRQAHGRCLVCGSANGQTPWLQFTALEDGGVEASFASGRAYEGYAGILHGGFIATLLDAAMTNCLFASGQCGLTADLQVRFRHPVTTDRPCRVRAWVERSSPPLFVLRAEVWQAGQLRTAATGKFMEAQSSISPRAEAR